MILHMLRWTVGDATFDKALHAFAQQYGWKAASVDDFRKVVEQAAGGHQLSGFFTQWLDSTGAPEFKNR